MREILFRGKRADNREWVCGYYVVQNGIHQIYYDIPGREWNIWSVDPATVGQYTGLTDKNGKRIFEGDIVKYGADYERKNIVVFEQGCFQLQGNGGLAPLRYHNLISSYVLDGYVIGTIHDAPDKKGESNV